MSGWVIAVIFIAAVVIVCRGKNRNDTVSPARNEDRNTPQQNRDIASNEKTETGPMVYYANDRHGSSDREYRFNYKKVNGTWRAYIIRMPSLGNRQAGGVATHRMWDESKPYICWDSSVNSLRDMQTISRVWADNIQEYIATGKRFG